MNLLIQLRDKIDRIFYPFVAALIKNRKTIRVLLFVFIVLGFSTLLFPIVHKQMGELAWLLLLLILFLSPISKIAQSKALTSLMIFRREAGILLTIFAIEHAILYFIKYEQSFNIIFNSDFWIRNGKLTYGTFGLLSLITIMPLFITSNNLSMRILKTNWKKLHRLAYVLLILVSIHVLILRKDYLKIFIILFTYGLLKFLVKTGFKIPIANIGIYRELKKQS